MARLELPQAAQPLVLELAAALSRSPRRGDLRVGLLFAARQAIPTHEDLTMALRGELEERPQPPPGLVPVR